MMPIVPLPGFLAARLDSLAAALLRPAHGPAVDFAAPSGEAALLAADSVSWRVFKNPVALFVGGIAAVLLELAEPAVRTGVWVHSRFVDDPVGRLRATGLAAMVTVYGARSVAEPMIARIVRLHSQVRGRTPGGEDFHANDPRLLAWVQATATFGFGTAYARYVADLTDGEADALYREAAPAALLYGAHDAPRSRSGFDALLASMHERLEPSYIVHEFLRIMHRAPALPPPLRPLQGWLVRAAVDLLPLWVRRRLELGPTQGLNAAQALIVRAAGALADRIVIPGGPAAQACRRLQLPVDLLYARERRWNGGDGEIRTHGSR